MQERSAQYLVMIFPVAALLLSIGCSGDKVSPAVAAAAPQPVQTSAVPKAASEAEPGFSVSGPLTVEHQLDILAQRDGIIAHIAADLGAHVKAGDLLAQVDDRQLRADLEATKAKTRSIEADLNNWRLEAKVLQSDYDRAQKMWDAQLITKEQLEHARYKAEADEWDIQRVTQLLVNARETENSLQIEMEKTRIAAPFAGVVARRYVREGQQVAKGDRIFWVTAEGPLRMRFTVPEKFLGRIRRGQELSLALSEFPGRLHRCRIVELSPVVDPASGTFDGTVELVGRPEGARPGMNATLRIASP